MSTVAIDSISPPTMTPFSPEKVPTVASDSIEKGSGDAGNIQPEAVDKWDSMSEHEQKLFEKKLVRKLDLRLIPWVTLLYLFSFLDRSSIGNAKILGVLFPFSSHSLTSSS